MMNVSQEAPVKQNSLRYWWQAVAMSPKHPMFVGGTALPALHNHMVEFLISSPEGVHLRRVFQKWDGHVEFADMGSWSAGHLDYKNKVIRLNVRPALGSMIETYSRAICAVLEQKNGQRIEEQVRHKDRTHVLRDTTLLEIGRHLRRLLSPDMFDMMITRQSPAVMNRMYPAVGQKVKNRWATLMLSWGNVKVGKGNSVMAPANRNSFQASGKLRGKGIDLIKRLLTRRKDKE